MVKLKVFFAFFILLFSLDVFSNSIAVDYYGVVAETSNKNMLKMAQDVFYTQLKAIDSLSVFDKRPEISSVLDSDPQIQNFSGTADIAFYVKITENSDLSARWECEFIARKISSGDVYSKTRTYDTYYKILMASRGVIEELIIPLKKKSGGEELKYEEIPSKTYMNLNEADLAGVWGGEPFADKIILLRGGRGFVILKNGATMNVSLDIKESEQGLEVFIHQTGKPNASFFPEISRTEALEHASAAEPVQWELKMEKPGIMTGIKKTLLYSESNPEKIERGSVPVMWTKKN